MKLALPLLALSLVLSAHKCSKAGGSAMTQASSLLDTKWNLQTLAGKAIEMPAGAQTPWLQVSSEANKVTGFGGCNNLMGTASVDLMGKIGFPNLGSTKMYCEQTANIERQFTTALGSVDSFKLDGDKLKLMQGMTELASFAKAK